MAHAYILDRSDVLKGVALAAWVVACDAALKLVARLGGCGSDTSLDTVLETGLWSAPASCSGTDMAGASIRLLPQQDDGLVLGLGSGMSGLPGQMYALGLLFLATALSILVWRWRWQANGDPQALGAIWGAAFVGALPRLLGDGSGLSELELFGFSAGVGDIALLWGLIWLGMRWIGELRA